MLQRRHVLKMVVGQWLTVALIGAVIGLIAAFGLAWAMTILLFGVRPTDTIGAALASYIPARRATKVDPMVTLRYE